MTSFLWWIPLAAGFQDGINPCVLIVAACSLLGLIWLRRFDCNPYWLILFFGTVLGCSFFLNAGYVDQIILHNKFFFIVRWIYVGLAVVVGIQGVEYLFQWIAMLKGKVIQEEKIKTKLSPLVLMPSMLVLGFLLSVLNSLWPINYYISVFSVYIKMPGQFLSMGTMIFLYTLTSFWLVYLVLSFVLLQKNNLRLFKILVAAILLSASISVVDLLL